MSNEEKNVDMVNHPPHYEGNTSLECIKVMKLIFGVEAVCYFCLCNAFKYLWRYKNKNGQQDIEKARWYLDFVDHELEVNDEGSLPEWQKINGLYRRLDDLYIDITDYISTYGIE